MYQGLLILQRDIIILSFIKCIIIRDLYVYQIVVPPILLSEPRQYALRAIGILAAVAIELVFTLRMLVAAAIVFAPEVYVHAAVGCHDLCKVVFEKMILMGVYVTLIAEVGIIILTVFGGLGTAGYAVFNLLLKYVNGVIILTSLKEAYSSILILV